MLLYPLSMSSQSLVELLSVQSWMIQLSLLRFHWAAEVRAVYRVRSWDLDSEMLIRPDRLPEYSTNRLKKDFKNRWNNGYFDWNNLPEQTTVLTPSSQVSTASGHTSGMKAEFRKSFSCFPGILKFRYYERVYLIHNLLIYWPVTSFTVPHPPDILTVFLVFINGITIVHLCSNSESFFYSWRISPNQWWTTLHMGRCFIGIRPVIVRVVILCGTFFFCEAKAFIGINICIYDQIWLIFKSLNVFISYPIIDQSWKCTSAKGTDQSLAVNASVPQCLGTNHSVPLCSVLAKFKDLVRS